MYEKLEECPLCQFSSHANYLIVDDHSISKESFALVQCNKCAFLYTNPRPTQEFMDKYYDSAQYISHSNKGRSIVNFVYKLARLYTIRWKENIVNKYQSKGSILDYGCGTGNFLKHMQTKGWSTKGVEPNALARQQAVRKGITVTDSIDNTSKDKVDIITAWHVMEHVHDLIDTIRILRKKLNPGGHLILALPNCASFDAQHYHQYWAGYDVPRHLYHFTPATVNKLSSRTKFKLTETIGMPLDAFYVSILSEKYKNSSNALIKGLLTGFKSNRQARKDGNYSSLIYVLTK